MAPLLPFGSGERDGFHCEPAHRWAACRTSDPVNVWLEAARPKTLSAAVVPVIVGSAAVAHEAFVGWRFAAALVVALALQVGVNYANDFFDAVKGVDDERRVGPRRAVAAGLVSPGGMRAAMLAAFGVAVIAGIALSAAAGWWLIALGAACFVAAVAYSGGPRPYASAGLGEVFVFVFFGLVATTFSAYVQVERFAAPAFVAAVPVGLLAVAILQVNNLRDIPTDAATGKRTLAVRMGDRPARRLYVGVLLGTFLALPLVAAESGGAWPLLSMLSLPLAAGPARAVLRGASGAALRPVLLATARLQVVFGALLALGLLL